MSTEASTDSASQATASAEWYTTTGEALVTTIAINVVAPRTPDALEYFVFGPWRRRAASAAAAVTQKELNKSWKGERSPQYPRMRPFCACVARGWVVVVVAVVVVVVAVVVVVVTVAIFFNTFSNKLLMLLLCIQVVSTSKWHGTIALMAQVQ